ncbi:DUF6203 family protein [Streptosporangium amethystogenes subsp. fukuiense]|uniref:DUF6203 family protein n=1 Tax=Streptosporangium amethystogenes subsp. fukuiense TaxID=698418 RepID=A0ABW2SYC7_9ACTN
MKNFLKAVVARRLVRTPIGLAILAAGWFMGRRRRQRALRRGEEPDGVRRDDSRGRAVPVRSGRRR